MSFAPRTAGRRMAALAVLTLLPMAAQAELRPAILPAEICLVLANGPFDADIAALIADREDFAAILVEAETSCPELAGNLVGATATIPSTAPNNDTQGPGTLLVIPPVTATIPATEPPPPAPPAPPAPPVPPAPPNPDGETPVGEEPGPNPPGAGENDIGDLALQAV